MTNDYKQNILDYITNNVTEQNGTNEPQIPTPTLVNNNVYDYLFQNLPNIDTTATYPIYVTGYIENKESQLLLYFGFYMKNDDTSKGFIYIVDVDMNPVQLITKLTSGSDLFNIYAMNQDENGYMYAISSQREGETYVKRLLLFNNILIAVNNTYMARLRQSYIMPNADNYDLIWQQSSIKKVNGESIYYVVLSNKTTLNTTILEIKINVGEQNEWNIYNLDGNYATNRVFSTLTEKNGSNVNYYFYSTNNNKELVIIKLYNGTLSKKTLYIDNSYYYLSSTIYARNLNEIYITWREQGTTNVKIAKTNQNAIEKITTIPIANLDSYPNIIIKNTTDDVLTIMIFRYQNNGGVNEPYISIGIIDNDNFYFSNDYATNVDRETINISSVFSNYNLVNMYIPVSSGTQKFTLDYNPLNYNGLPYSNYNQTKAVKGRLYSNGEMVFARNLYNATILNSTSTYTLNVPNTLLNGTQIGIENLIGVTNGTLVSNTLTITKNIYENLYINFINTLNVIDEDTNTVYQPTANYITQNINVASKDNCQNTFVGKVRVNYENSQLIQNINWTWDTDHYETEFTIDATQEIPTLDFMSSDESTIYISKELDIATGNYYKINQKLRIE